MKLLLTALAVALVGAAPPADEEVLSSAATPERDRAVTEQPALDNTPTPVINPDRRCDPKIVTADGRDDQAEFRREPAGPNPPPLFRAVDISVDDCDMLLSMSGELRPLPEPPAETGLIPIPSQ